MSPSQVRLIRAVGLVLAAAACRSAGQAPAGAAPAPAASSASAAQVRADSMRYPYTAADIHFMSAMIGHHAQAITMSRLAPRNGASPSIRTLAERIINAQEDEIAIMQRWLRDRGQPVPEPGSATGMQHGDHAMHGMSMPGMLTPEQLKQLEEAKGKEFDRLFLTFMIQHHRGAITMVKELFATPGAAQDQAVFQLASDVNVDQTTEVARMAQMLAEIVFEQRPP